MLIIADMDGTLTESRQTAEKNMIDLICKILKKHFFCIISGASYGRMKKQILDEMPLTPGANNLYVAAQSGAEIRDYTGIICEKPMRKSNKELVKTVLRNFALPHAELLKEHGIRIIPENPLIVDKGSQITFAIAGINTDIEIKKQVDPEMTIRKTIVERLRPLLPSHIKIAIGGTTSVDFTSRGVDKRFAVQYLQKRLITSTGDVVYIGDKCFVGGNDWIGEEYKYHNVNGPAETLKILESFL